MCGGVISRRTRPRRHLGFANFRSMSMRKIRIISYFSSWKSIESWGISLFVYVVMNSIDCSIISAIDRILERWPAMGCILAHGSHFNYAPGVSRMVPPVRTVRTSEWYGIIYKYGLIPRAISGYMDQARAILPKIEGLGQYCSPLVHITWFARGISPYLFYYMTTDKWKKQ